MNSKGTLFILNQQTLPNGLVEFYGPDGQEEIVFEKKTVETEAEPEEVEGEVDPMNTPISELLKRLKVTKQSLNRVLKDLIKLEAIDFKSSPKCLLNDNLLVLTVLSCL